ncbi:MAG: T9SS type A sorting domain-containing protein, partial [Bacteroidota bacterium]
DGQIISVCNTHIAVKDQEGDWQFASTLANFTSSLNISAFKFDPRVIYDPATDRYILFMIAGNSSAATFVLVGFSQTNDAAGDWNLYVIDGNPFDTNTWIDYPMISLTENEVFLTANSVRDAEPWETGFDETLIWQVNKQNGYDGEPLTIELWSDINFGGMAIRNLHPVKYADQDWEDKMYFLSNRNFDVENDSIFILEITSTQDDPSVTLEIDVQKADIPYRVPVNGQMEEGFLSTNDARILDGLYFQDQIQFVSNTTDPISGKAAVYHGIIENLNSTRDITAQIIVGDNEDDLGYASIAYTGVDPSDRDAIILVSHSSATRFPGHSALYFNNDREYSDLVTVKEGEAVINMLNLPDGFERWGDYSGNQRVYNQPGVVWVSCSFGEFGKRNDTWVSEIARPGLFSSVDEISETKVEVKMYPNPTVNEVNVEFELPERARIEIDLVDQDGRLVRRFLDDKTKRAGKMRFVFNTAPLKAGIYTLVIRKDDLVLNAEAIIVQ